MKEVFTTLHPALYEFNTKQNFDIILDSTNAGLTKEMDVLGFYKLLSPIIAKIGCGHTAVGLPDDEKKYIRSFIPVKLKFLRGKAYIIENFSNNLQLKEGQEVIAINGELMPSMVRLLTKSLSAICELVSPSAIGSALLITSFRNSGTVGFRK